jgi:hypothetical protein
MDDMLLRVIVPGQGCALYDQRTFDLIAMSESPFDVKDSITTITVQPWELRVDWDWPDLTDHMKNLVKAA